ncbi:MAG: phosphatidylglycerophosphatase A [Desulfohalobiaceae bacterium]
MSSWLEKTDSLLMQLATLGPIGRIPFAPGTWGSMAAVLVAPWLLGPLSWVWKLLLLMVLFLLGAWACGSAEKLLGEKDPGAAVIDEFAGQLLVFALCSPAATWQFAAGFVLFRALDILKPWPVGASETWLPAGFGIMLDDILAGLYAGSILLLLQLLQKSLS